MISRCRRGQSLIEILVAIAVGAILIGGAAAVILPSLFENSQALNIQAQTELAQEMTNNLQAWAFSGWNNVLALATGSANGYILNTSSSPFIASVSTSTTGPTYNGYSFYRPIVISSSSVSGTLSNFPVLVASTSSSFLAASSSGGLVQNANGYDIIFTSDNACANKLNFETESYSSSTGAIISWVQIPSLTSSTIFYLCYRNPGITNDQSNASGTWDTNYEIVMHLPNGTTLNTKDSTRNANGTTPTGVTAVSGEIDGGAGFNGSSYITTNYRNSLNDFTACAWFIDPSTDSASQRILDKQFSVGFWMGEDARGGIDSWGGGIEQGNYPYGTYVTLPHNQWHLLCMERSGAVGTVIGDGSITATSAVSTSSTGPFDGLMVGAAYGPLNNFTGSIDEVEVSNVARSAGWILTQYNNQVNPSAFAVIMNPHWNPLQATLAGITYSRYFYVNDVFRDASGNATTSPTSTYYDPSTKQVVIVIRPVYLQNAVTTTYSFYLTRSSPNVLTQSSWSGGAGQITPLLIASSTYSTSSNISINGNGAVTLGSPNGGSCVQ